ncbi:hypothetical protein Tco_0766742, partial [Tanacetum coccineum]
MVSNNGDNGGDGDGGGDRDGGDGNKQMP